MDALWSFLGRGKPPPAPAPKYKYERISTLRPGGVPVYKVRALDDGTEWAMKVIPDQPTGSDGRQIVLREYKNMKQASHPKILKVCDYFTISSLRNN